MKTCSMRTLSIGSRGRSAGSDAVTFRPAKTFFSRRSNAEPRISSIEPGSFFIFAAPDSSRVVSMRLFTRRASHSPSDRMFSRSSRVFVESSEPALCKRLLAEPMIAASGVRRSCETELNSVLRSRSFRSRSARFWHRLVGG